MATSPSRNEGARHGAQRPRKRQVLDQIIQGNSQTKEIARSLALSPRTWRFIAANVLHKWAPATRLISCARCSAARKHRSRAYPSRNRRKIRLNDAGLRIRWQYRLQRRAGDRRYYSHRPKAEPYASLIESTRINGKLHCHSIWT